jgi:hypothetical protein
MIPLPLRYRTGLVIVCALLLTLAAPPAAQPVAVEGMFIPVENPITEEVARASRTSPPPPCSPPRRRPARAGQGRGPQDRPRLYAQRRPANSTAFGGCYELTRHLLSLQDVTTIAFLHGEVSRHSVLPVLACKEVVMSSEAKLGPVIGGDDRPLDESEEAAYRG